jgi:hypothetical protein
MRCSCLLEDAARARVEGDRVARGMRVGAAQGVDEFNRGSGVVDGEAPPGDGLAVYLGVEVGKTIGEGHVLAVDLHRTIDRSHRSFRRKIRAVDGQKPADVGVLQFKVTRHAARLGQVQGAAAHAAEKPQDGVEEMHADVRGNTAGPARVALPRVIVPQSPRGHIGQLDIEAVSLLPPRRDTRAHVPDGGMQAQLEHGVHAAPALALEFLQRVQVPGVEHQRLLADGRGAHAQGLADVRIVQVVGRADAHPVHALLGAPTVQAVEVAVETFVFAEVAGPRKVAVQDADGIVRIHGREQGVAGVADGLQVPRGDVSCDAGDGEVQHPVPPSMARVET